MGLYQPAMPSFTRYSILLITYIVTNISEKGLENIMNMYKLITDVAHTGLKSLAVHANAIPH